MNSLVVSKARLSVLLIFSAILFQNTIQAQNRDISQLSSGGKLNPIQANMDIRHYTLSLDVDIPNKKIAGFTEVETILAHAADSLLLDLIDLYNVTAVKVNNKPVKFDHSNNKIYITGSFPAGKQLIRVDYNGEPPVAVRPPWGGGFTWTKDSLGNDWVAINCQKEGGRVYFACKDHPSDEPNEGVDMYISIPKNLVVSGPGLLQKVTTVKNKATYHWKTNYTISNYCVVFNIGKYKVVSKDMTTINGHVVPIQFYVLEEDTAEAKKLIELKERDTHILEKYFGEYPWWKEKIGICEVPNSGMEHQTNITFQNKFVYSKIGTSDYSANLLHEYAHEWWANKVTNKDWAHMWIQEGIGTYAEALTMYELGGQAAYDQIIDGHKRGIRYKKPMVGVGEMSEDETYNQTDIYAKGSFFMHSLRYLIGDEIFLPTLKKLATDPAYTYDNMVTTDDVEKLFSGAAKQDLKPFFDFFLRTTDVLDITVKETGYQKYLVKLNNYFMDLPFEITTASGTSKMTMVKNGLTINSSTPPLIDPKGFYLKKVLYLQ
ncbi:MAG: M1 family metallopeptidase [Chitinophagaceae bacterium]|nr:M1 family metallopeptidase [Chitinophagaceae bacterium]